ncbi:hypothetical protein [Dyadobacter sp. 3J3]|uniref:hypothetical protein n=1 Tax=Dyadobacter sp. 3J3 TaxID=2606600 RepID=UPI00135A8085|nr:hypothetical protein [Dyadobacter sp. 3J3]
MKTLFTVLLKTSVFSLIIVAAFLLCLTIGCETTPTTENLPQSSLFKVGNIELDVVNMTKSEANIGEYDPEKPNFSQVRLDLNSEMAEVLTKKLESHFNQSFSYKGQQPKFITLFTTKSTTDIGLSDIQGISVMTIQNSGLYHNLYTVSGNSLKKDDRFSVYTEHVRLAEMNWLGAVVFKNPSIKWTMINMSDLRTSALNAARTTEETYPAYNLGTAITNASDVNFVTMSDCTSCGDPTAAVCEWVSSINDFKCNVMNWGGPCEESEINAQIGATNARTASLNNEEAYNFRDHFLSKTEKGRSYINFYYAISKAAIQSKAINKKSVGQHFDFAVKVHGIAQKLQSGSDAEIVYKEDFKKEAQSFINNYRTLSKDKAYLTALATIEKDLHRFNGKSRKEILLSIGK